MTFTNVTGVPINTLVPEDATAFEWMHDIINYEPAEAFGKELLGRLRPSASSRASHLPPTPACRVFCTRPPRKVWPCRASSPSTAGSPMRLVYSDRNWESPFIGDSSSFDPDGYYNLEARTTFHFTADGITPSMAAQMPDGLGSRYQTTYKDKDGNFFDGDKTYKLNVLPKVPVKLFWAVTVYDPWTRCEIQSQPYPSISSQQDPPPTTNADGSIDIYFSNDKPKDIPAQNWVKTLPNQGFFVYMRYYGPAQGIQ